MKIVTGSVSGGQVLVDATDLEEGSIVTVLVSEDDVTLTPEEVDELTLAIAEADRGELVTADELLKKLKNTG